MGMLHGSPLVVREAPQLELIKAAKLVINHGGVNTVLETLLEGKPMIAIPIAHDQPALAARLAWLGIAEVVPQKALSAKRLRYAVKRVLNNASYCEAVAKAQAEIQSARGLERAVELIEGALAQSVEKRFDANGNRGAATSE
jgi:UDP:flavonoid glycosyltransferase YjiC (YdhE family)